MFSTLCLNSYTLSKKTFFLLLITFFPIYSLIFLHITFDNDFLICLSILHSYIILWYPQRNISQNLSYYESGELLSNLLSHPLLDNYTILSKRLCYSNYMSY